MEAKPPFGGAPPAATLPGGGGPLPVMSATVAGDFAPDHLARPRADIIMAPGGPSAVSGGFDPGGGFLEEGADFAE